MEKMASLQDEATSGADAGAEERIDGSSVAESSADEWLAVLTDVLEAAVRGDLERRITHVTHFDAHLSHVSILVNQLLDVTDAFVRESGAALEHASRKKFYRKLVLRGMPGCFRHAAALINNAAGEMAVADHALREAERKRKGFAEEFEGTVQGVVTSVASSADGLRATAQTLALNAQEVTTQVRSVADACDRTSHNMRSVSAATEQLTSAIGEIGRQVGESKEIATVAVGEAAQANQVMSTLHEASNRINGVVRMISQIAKKTNLLALNATIEAARAGEAGRGFTVVASEVKDLAQQTARATDEVSAELGAIRETTKGAVDAIARISTTIGRMSDIATVIAGSMEEQRAATTEISQNINEATQATLDVQTTAQHVTQSAEAASNAAGSVLNAADAVSADSGTLQQRAAQFLGDITGTAT